MQVTTIVGLTAAAVCLISDSPSAGVASGGQTTPHLAGLSHSLAVPGGSLHQLHGLPLVSFSSSLLLLFVLLTDGLVCFILLRIEMQLQMIGSHDYVAGLLHMPAVQQLLWQYFIGAVCKLCREVMI